ncbi:MAG: hypothetical protein WC756_03720 [Taibaiella sp.]|jgi:hypothetical protein
MEKLTPEEQEEVQLKPGQVVSFDIAKKEINAWLDGKRVSDSKREKEHIADAIETLIDAISYGDATIDPEKMTITQALRFPILNEDSKPVLSSLTFKPRLRTNELKDRTASVKQGDGIGRICAIAGALTGQATAIIEKMDTEDMAIVNAVAVFFL